MPGFLMTNNPSLSQMGSNEMLERARLKMPGGKFGEPQDAADAVAFLASEKAKFITGVEIPVAHGFGLWVL
jgi:3-oxoacyl-[acyl-carrier protein] reductase